MRAITIQNLSKNFGKTHALKDVSLEIESGQILGLLGPNGAGKTTLIKALVGGVRPTAGSAEVLGKNPLKHKKELSHRIGYMPQNLALYGDLSAYENVRFFGKLHRSEVTAEEIEKLLDFLGIADRKNDKVQNFSGGMERRVSLACAMVYEPDILFLDEPTAGLDPSLKRSLWAMFRDLARQGKTLIISTHLMEEALLCDMLAVIRDGALVTTGTPDELVSVGKVMIELGVEGGRSRKMSLSADPKTIAAYFQKHGLDKRITRVEVKHETLEDIIIRIMEGK